ncbi:TNFAIP3-interacting protein 3-like [Acanthaster planci]|uniref:TNFAIP3-interacting protein 3-like n=1 Tax=Acanthaster planci TaxID=133434 RepID=A0A8B7XJB3_ACAPL|nr:TNFAIP3-interacting protein 3-like [Acanthaster planci]
MHKTCNMCQESSSEKLCDGKKAELLPDMVSLEKLQLSQRQTAQKELENERLINQLKEVIAMNVRWQRYDDQRETYVRKLHAANRELHSKLAATEKTCAELQQQMSRKNLQEERPDLSGSTSPPKDSKASQERSDRTVPFCALDAKFARKEKEIATLTDQIERLEAQIASLQRSEAKRRDDEEEHIALFKAQLEVCMEDFRQERSDRERINAERQCLRQQLDESEQTITRLHQEVADLVEEICWLRDRPSRLTHHYRDPTVGAASPGLTHHYRYYPNSASKNYTKRRGVPETTRRMRAYYGHDVPDQDSVCHLPSDVTIDGEDSNDGVTSPSAVIPTASLAEGDSDALVSIDGGNGKASSLDMTEVRDCIHDLSDEATEEKPLACPLCLIEFPVEKHAELLKHIELCSGDTDIPAD